MEGCSELISPHKYPKCYAYGGCWKLCPYRFIMSFDLLETTDQLVDWNNSRLYHRLSLRRVFLIAWSNLCSLMGGKSMKIYGSRIDEAIDDGFGIDRSWVDDSRHGLDFMETVRLLTIVCSPDLLSFMECD